MTDLAVAFEASVMVVPSKTSVLGGEVCTSDNSKTTQNNDISSLSLCLRVNYDFPINHHTLHNTYQSAFR